MRELKSSSLRWPGSTSNLMSDRVTLVDHVCAATTDTPIVHLEPERALGHSLLMVACEIYGDANEFLGPLFNPPAAVRVGVCGTVFAAEAAQLT